MVSRNFQEQLPSIDEFLGVVETTNKALESIGVTPVPASIVRIGSYDQSTLFWVENVIELSYRHGAPILAHEAYHRHVYEHLVLTPEEIERFDSLRGALSEKIEKEIERKDAHLAAILEASIPPDFTGGFNIGHGIFYKWGGVSLDPDEYYLIPTTSDDISIINDPDWSPPEHRPVLTFSKPVTTICANYKREGDAWKKRSQVGNALRSDPQVFLNLLNDDELCFIRELASLTDTPSDSPFEPLNKKLTARRKALSWGSTCGSEGGAYLIQTWLEGKVGMNDYEQLIGVVRDGIYRSSGFGRGCGEEYRLAKAVVGSYQRFREAGSSIEDALGRTIEVENMLGIIGELKYQRMQALRGEQVASPGV